MKKPAKSKPWRAKQPDDPSKYGDLQSPILDGWESPAKDDVEFADSLMTLRGKTARNAKKICRDTGVPLNVLLKETMRVFVELPKSERKKGAINWQRCTKELFRRLDKWKQKRGAKPVWNSIPETQTDGWMFGSYTRYAEQVTFCNRDELVALLRAGLASPVKEMAPERWTKICGKKPKSSTKAKPCRGGDGFIIAPDGQRAELDWHVGTDKLKRTGRADKRIWGVFEIGFPLPVMDKADLVENFRAVLPQIKAAFARHRKRRQ